MEWTAARAECPRLDKVTHRLEKKFRRSEGLFVTSAHWETRMGEGRRARRHSDLNRKWGKACDDSNGEIWCGAKPAGGRNCGGAGDCPGDGAAHPDAGLDEAGR